MSYSADMWPTFVEVVNTETDEVVAKFYSRDWPIYAVRERLIALFGYLGENMEITDMRCVEL